MILYFSATGNSKYCAEKLAEKTGEKLFSIKDAMKKSVPEIDCENSSVLGIVVPTHGWDVPWAVADYLREVKLINLPQNAYIFSVHTCGNMSGASAVKMRELLEEKGLHLNSAFSIVMMQSEYLFGKKTSEEERKQILDNADHAIDEIVSDISQKNNVVRMRKTMPVFMATAVGKLVGPSQRKVSKFHVSDACIGCGTCSRNCPQNLIEVRDKRPVWTADRCLNCFACVTYCPKHAIYTGKKK